MFIVRILLFTLFHCLCDSYNILVFFPHTGKSHFVIYETLLTKLVAKGHNLSVIGYFPRKEIIRNYRDVSLVTIKKDIEGSERLTFEDLENKKWFRNMAILHSYVEKNCRIGHENENFRGFLKEDNQFDVILIQYFVSECFMGVVKGMNAPYIGKFLK